MRVRVRVRVRECGRKIRNANRMPKSDDRTESNGTESNLRRGRREGGREDGGRQGGGEGRRGGGEEGGGVFDLKNQGLGFAPDRKKPCYRKSNSS